MFKLVIYLTLLYITDFVVCEPDYKYYEDVNGWLKFHTVPTKWQDAFLQCHYEGAVLASPINSDLKSALSHVMSEEGITGPSGIFIGSNALFSEGDYISIEGVPLADMPVKWYHGRDNNERPEKCLYFYDQMVSPIECSSYKKAYICYKERNNSTTLNECGTFDNEYHFNRETGSCYKVHSEDRSWSEAHKVCVAEGGYLTIINDEEEANIIKNMIPQEWSGVSIGLRKWQKDLWLTIHGEKIENVYDKWGNRATGYLQPAYARLLSDGTLSANDRLSFESPFTLSDSHGLPDESPFICEKDPNTSRFQVVSE